MTTNRAPSPSNLPDPDGVPIPFAVDYQGTLHYLYLDQNYEISDIWFDGSNWQHRTINRQVTGASRAQAGPVAVVYNGALHVLYLDAKAQISDLWLTEGGTWWCQSLNDKAGSNALPSRSSPSTVIAGNCYQAVYLNANGRLSNIYSDATNSYYQDLNDLAPYSQIPGGPAVAVVYANQLHNVYRDQNQNISDIWFDGSECKYQRLNYFVTGEPLAAKGPASMVYHNGHHNLYVSYSQRISDIWFDGNKWQYQDLNDLATDAPLAATSPSSVDYQNGQHDLYLDVNGKISDIWFDGDEWRYQNLNDLARAAPSAQGRPFSCVFEKEHHTLYLDVNGKLSDIWYDGTTWQYRDLSGCVPWAPLPQCRLASLRVNDHAPHLRFKKNAQSETWFYDAKIDGGSAVWLPLADDRLYDLFLAQNPQMVSLFVDLDVEGVTNPTIAVKNQRTNLITLGEAVTGYPNRTKFDMTVALDEAGANESFSVKVSWDSGLNTDPTFKISRNG